MSRLSAVVVGGAVLVGVAGAAVAFSGHGGEEVLRLNQSRSLKLTPETTLSAARVQAFVAKAPEPVAAAKRTRVALVRCRPGEGGPLRNPWSCVISYRSGTRAHYRVIVQPNGSYTGVGTGIIEGCCVKTPAVE